MSESRYPKDSAMLLSYVNMKLRDYYETFATMCDDMEIEPEEIIAILHEAGYHYDEERNRFV